MTLENRAIDFLKVYILILILRCNKKKLVNDIRLINDQIQALNVSNGMSNIRLDKPLQKTKIFNKGSKSKKIFNFVTMTYMMEFMLMIFFISGGTHVYVQQLFTSYITNTHNFRRTVIKSICIIFSFQLN
jgi:hypothetical protein